MKPITAFLTSLVLLSARGQEASEHDVSIGLNPVSALTSRYEALANYRFFKGLGLTAHLGWDISREHKPPHNLDRNRVSGPYMLGGVWLDIARMGKRTTLRPQVMGGGSLWSHLFRIRVPTYYADYVSESRTTGISWICRAQLALVTGFRSVQLHWGVAANVWKPRTDALAQAGHWQVPGASYEWLLTDYDLRTDIRERVLDQANERGWSLSPFFQISWYLD
jgi:hypothetical protein